MLCCVRVCVCCSYPDKKDAVACNWVCTGVLCSCVLFVLRCACYTGGEEGQCALSKGNSYATLVSKGSGVTCIWVCLVGARLGLLYWRSKDDVLC